MSRLTELYDGIQNKDGEVRRKALDELAALDQDFNVLYHAHTERKAMKNCLINFSGDRLDCAKSIRRLVAHMRENKIVRFTMSEERLDYAYAFQESGCRLIKLVMVRTPEFWGTKPKTAPALLFEIEGGDGTWE